MKNQITSSSRSKKVALGMSGGVDSSVCAYLLKEQGYDVTGVYLECWRAPGCRTEEDRKDALKVALELGIPFQVLDFKQQYKDKVVENFFAEYEAGRTPNPDVLCNKEIKFGLFYDWAMDEGYDLIATGHYARVETAGEGEGVKSIEYGVGSTESQNTAYSILHPNRYFLTTSTDERKDQTYFLYRLRAEQLSHILFPIGHLTKNQVRTEAKNRKIATAEKPDSQGICFIGEINVHNFLKERLGENPGEVINTKGEVMGSHNGLWFYTIGQRHGFEIFGKWKSEHGEVRHAMPPYYVIDKIPASNQLVVGFGAETFKNQFEVEDVHWLIDLKTDSPHQGNLYVRIRHGGKLIPIKTLLPTQVGFKVELSESVQGLAEGQSAVIYAESDAQYVCVGGGVIARL